MIFALSLLLCGCYNPQMRSRSRYSQRSDGPPKYYRNINTVADAQPRYLPRSLYGNPPYYTVNGKTYHVLATADGYNQRGIASWYGSKFSGHLTSTHERYNPYQMTAASPVLPIPCFARVTNLENGRSVIVKVNDRGPFAPNRIIDLSFAAASKLGYQRRGTAMVDVTTIDTQNPYPLALNTFKTNRPHLFLQVGVFRYENNADLLQKRVTLLTDKSTVIYTDNQNGDPLYHVQIGPLRGVGEADKLHALLEKKGYGDAISIIR